MKNERVVYLSIILVLIITLIIICTLKLRTKEEPVNNIDDKIYEVYSFDFNSCDIEKEKKCSKTVNSIDISIELNNNDAMSLYINNEIVNDDIWFLPERVDVLDGIVIFASGKTDVRSTEIFAYDTNGKMLLDIYEVDGNYPTMVVDDAEDSIYSILNNKITFKGSRVFHGPLLIESDDDYWSNDYMCENETKQDKVAKGLYEITYLGNGKFSEIKNIEYYKVRMYCN